MERKHGGRGRWTNRLKLEQFWCGRNGGGGGGRDRQQHLPSLGKSLGVPANQNRSKPERADGGLELVHQRTGRPWTRRVYTLQINFRPGFSLPTRSHTEATLSQRRREVEI